MYIDAKTLNTNAIELQNTNCNLSTLSIECEKLTEKNSTDVIRARFSCTDTPLLSTTEFWNMENGAPKWQFENITNYSKLEKNYIVVSFSCNLISNYLLTLPCRAKSTCHDFFFKGFPVIHCLSIFHLVVNVLY